MITTSKPAAARVQSRFRAMGTDAHVIVDSDPCSDSSDPPGFRLQRVVDHIEDLEARWSRFRGDSELSRLNERSGYPTIVSAATSLLLQRAVCAWRATAGRFDPTILDAVISAGYDRSFEMIDQRPDRSAVEVPVGSPSTGHVGQHRKPAPGCESVLVDPQTNLVMVPAGVGIDPGGIAKGLAADLTATTAVASGATAALVSLGGDLRVAGTPPSEGWEVEINHHIAEPARINLHAGAVATSSVLRRRWMTPNGEAHHIIDPRTGSPCTGQAVAVSVVAGEAWWAEALATAVLVAYSDAAVTGDTCTYDTCTDDTLTDEYLAAELADLLGAAGALVTLSNGSQRTFGSAGHAFSSGSLTTPEVDSHGEATDIHRTRQGAAA